MFAAKKKIIADESFVWVAASLVPAKDLTVDARIEIEYGPGGRAFSACPRAGTYVYSWEIHRGARIPPRAEPVPFGQNKNVVSVQPTEPKLSYQCVSGGALSRLGRKRGINGGFD